jgi:hypothetical protein
VGVAARYKGPVVAVAKARRMQAVILEDLIAEKRRQLAEVRERRARRRSNAGSPPEPAGALRAAVLSRSDLEPLG